jgi:hypothetical protein
LDWRIANPKTKDFGGDPDSQLIEFLSNENGRFVVQSAANDRYQSTRFPEVEIQLANFWREVAERWPPERV